MADGMLTPAVTVTTAIEGLRSIPAIYTILGDDQNKIIVITLLIIGVLFFGSKGRGHLLLARPSVRL